MTSTESERDELFLRNYNANDRRIASEFLSDWLPFLTNGLCEPCSIKLTHRVRSLRPGNYCKTLSFFVFVIFSRKKKDLIFLNFKKVFIFLGCDYLVNCYRGFRVFFSDAMCC